MAAVEDTGGYLTRGRARELYRRMDELEQQVDERLAVIEEAVADLVAFELELTRRRIAVEVELVRSYPIPGGGRWQTSRTRRSG